MTKQESTLFAAPQEGWYSLLPADGEAYYMPAIMDAATQAHFFERLTTQIAWQHDEAKIFGKHYITKRMVAWYGSKPYSYSYSRTTKLALPWTTELLHLKQLAETTTGHTYNSCLANLYPSGNEGMAWHSDDESTLMPYGAVAALSFGAQRRFCFRHKQHKTNIELNLQPGSLLLMKGSIQHHWLHSLPKMAAVKAPRISLTFRTMIEPANL